ncbi:endonuclease/exonuclease/phosphatase family protein [Micromonospora sp. NPDC001898]|uniref:endonuclease/exonuclease/phosphatase family protein n=1 Tax=Micromonospora sp. NPDC001898 TaxID=3364221 RepID=UPI0036916A88
MRIRARIAGLLAAVLAAGALTIVTFAGPASAAAMELRVVTANLAFRQAPGVRQDWTKIGPYADIVFFQEAKNVRLADVLGDGWIVRQDTSAEDRQGSAVAIRRALAAEIVDFELVKGTDGASCGGEPIMTRWITKLRLRLTNGRPVRLASLHMPPPRCQSGPGSPYAVMADNVVEFANRSDVLTILGADWNKIVDQDPNEIGARTGLKPRGPNSGLRIDGFYVSPAITTRDVRHLEQTGSDHRPVQMHVGIPTA